MPHVCNSTSGEATGGHSGDLASWDHGRYYQSTSKLHAPTSAWCCSAWPHPAGYNRQCCDGKHQSARPEAVIITLVLHLCSTSFKFTTFNVLAPDQSLTCANSAGNACAEPSSLKAMVQKAHCLLELGQSAEALEVTMECLVRHPQNIHALQIRAEALRQEGFLEAAMDDVQAVRRRAKPGTPATEFVEAVAAMIRSAPG